MHNYALTAGQGITTSYYWTNILNYPNLTELEKELKLKRNKKYQREQLPILQAIILTSQAQTEN